MIRLNLHIDKIKKIKFIPILHPNKQNFGKLQILKLKVMAIHDQHHYNKSKQTMLLAGFDFALPIGVVSISRFSSGNEEYQERHLHLW